MPRKQKGFFVTLPENEVHSADAGSTHAVDILAFVEAQEIPSLYFKTPYYLAPAPGGEQLYALLRETLRSTRKIGIACVMISSRQQLAVLVPEGQSLVLNTLRWGFDEYTADIPEDDGDEDMYASPGFASDPSTPFSLGLADVPCRPDASLAKLNMESRKGADIVIQEMGSLFDDDDPVCDAFLDMALRRRTHHPHRWASRATSPAFPSSTVAAQPRIRRHGSSRR